MSTKPKKKPLDASKEPPKVKLPKQYIVRPLSNVSKLLTKVYIHPTIFEALEFKKNDIVLVNKVDLSDPGVVVCINSDENIVDTNVITISNSVRRLGNIVLGDRVIFSKYKQPHYADTIVVNVQDPDVKVEKILDDIGLVSRGLRFESMTIVDVTSLEASMEQLQLSEAVTVNPSFIYIKAKAKIVYTDNQIKDQQFGNVNFDDIGGLSKQIESIKSIIELPLEHPQLFTGFGISPPRGILLHGPSGTGKTMILKSIVKNINAHILSINGPSIVSKYLGETETKIREIFVEARKFQPSIIIMDEIDSLVPSRMSDDSGEAESRVVSTLLTMMDDMNDNDNSLVVIGATNRINSIDSSLRRPGRFDQEIEINIPDVDDRFEILSKLIYKMSGDRYSVDTPEIKDIASKTHGYVGADLMALIRESVMKSISDGLRHHVPHNNIKLTYQHLLDSLMDIRPSAMREIFLEMPKVYWTDIGGQQELKRKLTEVIQLPLEANETFIKLGVLAPKGVLLYGPPGCSKTLTAKALATESGLNFLAVKGPEIFNKYVGESERAIREIFRKARSAAPSIIFFDEIDAISGDRESSQTSAAQQVLTSLLNEIDGIEELKGVVIVGATNRPTEIDAALLRPGRLDRHIYVPPPDENARLEILDKCCRKFNLGSNVELTELAKITEGCSGAEVTLLCQEAGLAAIMEDNNANGVEKRHFDHALKGISKGITEDMLAYYKEFAYRSGLDV